MIKSKFQFQETKISVHKRILKGRNINTDGYSRIYIEIIAFLNNGKMKIKRIPTDQWVKPNNWLSKKDDGLVSDKDPEYVNKNNIINKVFLDYVFQLQQL